MLIRMLIKFGSNWPDPGGTIEIDDETALRLISYGDAEAADAEPAKPKRAKATDVETAAVDGVTETAARKSTRARKAAQ